MTSVLEEVRYMVAGHLGFDLSQVTESSLLREDLRDVIAPPGAGVNIQDRVRVAARKLGWSFTRTKDVWYADPRVSIDGDDLVKIEEVSGISYGRAEVRSINQLIAQADALLEGADEDFHRPFVAAIRAFFGALDRSGTPGDR